MNTQIVVQKGNAIIPRKVVKKDVARLDWGGGGEEKKREYISKRCINEGNVIYIYYNCRDFDLEREKEEGNRR